MSENIDLELKREFKSSKIEIVKEKQNVAVVTATGNYIHIDEFKELFNHVGELVKSNKIDKLIFDKRALDTFHQPSMEWYYIEWKEKMFDYGLRTHRKILPKNDFFNFAVKSAKKDLEKKYPEGKYHQMDIQYRDNLTDAINS